MSRSYELTEAIATVVHKHPFFAVLLLDLLEIVETDAVPTAATDAKHLFINPKWYKEKCKTIDERVFVLAHEILHVVMSHPTRMKYYRDLGFGPDMKPWSANKANQAMDYIINDTLIADKIGQPPVGSLINPRFTKDMIWDDVYQQLPDDDSDDGWDQHMGSDVNNAPSQAQVQRAIASAAAAAKAQGKLPGSMQRLVDSILNPQVPWQDLLRKSIAAATGKDRQTWARPNRRRLAAPPHVYWPGTAGSRCGCVVSVNDTSGSVSDKEQSTFFGELQAILNDLQPDPLYVMFVDAAVHGIHELHDPNELENLKSEVKGGGGTDMTVAFQEFEKLDVRPETCIIFTDGYTPFGEDTGIPTIWCITSEVRAPWGTTVNVKV